MPIFEYIKSQDSKKTLTFDSWYSDNLEVKLIKRTSVLEVYYFDNNKKLIVPVLTKISKLYQDYSKKQKINTLHLV